MPIGIDEFERGHVEDPYSSKILEFLKNNPDKAFNVEEIVKEVRQKQNYEFIDVLRVGSALMILGFNRKIQSKFILNPMGVGEYYYRISK